MFVLAVTPYPISSRYTWSMKPVNRLCEAPWCRKPLRLTARADAKFCSDACRVLFARRGEGVFKVIRAYGGKCEQCHGPLRTYPKGWPKYARRGTLYCSTRCRVAAYRARKS